MNLPFPPVGRRGREFQAALFNVNPLSSLLTSSPQMMRISPVSGLYDPETRSWDRPDGGRFGKHA
jgi:hypothetical protein